MMVRTVGLCLALLAAASTADAAASARHDVRIRRDEWGVPHVLGRTDADAAYGLGYAQAEDDLATIVESVLAVRGQLATVKGPEAVESDYRVQWLDVWGSIKRDYARLVPADVRALMDAYAAGVNAYAAQHPDKMPAGLGPVRGEDLEASFIRNGPTFYGLEREIDKLKAPTKVAARDSFEPIGSNGLAVAPSRSADGATRLLVNSHQPYAGPVAWYEAVVQSGQGWHVAGGFFPGAPFMLHGHNEHLGWANTVNHPKLHDVFQLAINPDNPDQYRLDGAWRTLDKRTVQIRVKRPDGGVDVVKREVLRSAHGPVERTDHGVFALRYAGMGEVRQPVQYWRLNRARNLAEWRAAMALQLLPSINYVYADERGNIGYVYNGRIAVRSDAYAAADAVTPGDRADLIPTREAPLASLPQLWNPKSGYVFNSNNTPFHATDPADDLKPEAYPKWMGVQTDMSNRAYRVLETYGRDTSITEAEFDAYKYDLAYSPKSDAAKGRALLIALDFKADPELAAAQAVIRGWDLRTDLHNRGAPVAILTLLQVTQQKVPPLKALRNAVTELKARFGRIDPEWGEVNRIRRGKLDLPIDGGPDIYRAVYGKPDPDGRLRANAGDTYVMFVSWDRAGRLSSRSIHQFGSATQDEVSAHYADQTPLFVAHRTKPVLFTEAQLKGHVIRDYRPPG